MSEEIENAALNVPRAIFTTMVLNGAMGLAMMIAILFCIGDAEKVLVFRPPIRGRDALSDCGIL
jgi:amino acid transporter